MPSLVRPMSVIMYLTHVFRRLVRMTTCRRHLTLESTADFSVLMYLERQLRGMSSQKSCCIARNAQLNSAIDCYSRGSGDIFGLRSLCKQAQVCKDEEEEVVALSRVCGLCSGEA